MKLQEVITAFLEMYNDFDADTVKEKMQKYWDSVDFVCSDDSYEVAEDAMSSGLFDL